MSWYLRYSINSWTAVVRAISILFSTSVCWLNSSSVCRLFCSIAVPIVSFTNKTGVPILTKPMESHFNDDVTAENVLAVTLDPLDTVDLCGKYIYQITIKDINGNIEIPKQGILFITNNINKSFIRQ